MVLTAGKDAEIDGAARQSADRRIDASALFPPVGRRQIVAGFPRRIRLRRKRDRFPIRFHRQFALLRHIVNLARAQPRQRARVQIHFLRSTT